MQTLLFRPRLGLLSIVICVSLGCNSSVRMPRWNDPGNAATQRYEAIFYDPYPMTDAGPEIVGGRPREYQAPVPPVREGRLTTTNPTIAQPR